MVIKYLISLIRKRKERMAETQYRIPILKHKTS